MGIRLPPTCTSPTCSSMLALTLPPSIPSLKPSSVPARCPTCLTASLFSGERSEPASVATHVLGWCSGIACVKWCSGVAAMVGWCSGVAAMVQRFIGWSLGLVALALKMGGVRGNDARLKEEPVPEKESDGEEHAEADGEEMVWEERVGEARLVWAVGHVEDPHKRRPRDKRVRKPM